jgi:predicted membrane channel-forming protein YqfA (hemolysin III family)
MTMKVSAEDIFELEPKVDKTLLARLDVYKNRLHVALGIAITLVALIPELTYLETPIAPLILAGLLFYGIGQGVYLLFVPRWRAAPMAQRRRLIVQSFVLALMVLAFIPGMGIFVGDEEVFPLLVLLGLLAYGLHRLNKRWARMAKADDEELFP